MCCRKKRNSRLILANGLANTAYRSVNVHASHAAANNKALEAARAASLDAQLDVAHASKRTPGLSGANVPGLDANLAIARDAVRGAAGRRGRGGRRHSPIGALLSAMFLPRHRPEIERGMQEDGGFEEEGYDGAGEFNGEGRYEMAESDASFPGAGGADSPPAYTPGDYMAGGVGAGIGDVRTED